MKDPDAVQRLLRLKRYESPGEEFFAEFTESFKERQRAELLRRSSLSLFAERFGMWCSQRFEKRFALPVAGAIALLGLSAPVIWFTNSGTSAHPELSAAEETVAPQVMAEASRFDLSDPAVEVIELTIPSPIAPSEVARDGAVAPSSTARATASVPGAQVLPVSAGFGLREL